LCTKLTFENKKILKFIQRLIYEIPIAVATKQLFCYQATLLSNE